jgi:predicted Ser/Thr protein kinase
MKIMSVSQSRHSPRSHEELSESFHRGIMQTQSNGSKELIDYDSGSLNQPENQNRLISTLCLRSA